MKITLNQLIEKKVCASEIQIFKVGNWENYDFGSKEIVIKNNTDVIDYLIWLGDNFKIPNFKIKYEDSNGYWKKYEYNEKGLKIKYEDSYGLWGKYEYNEKGLKTKYETSMGTCEKYEYNY